MRILIPVEHLGPTDGVAVQTFQVSRELARRGHVIDVVHLNGGNFEDQYRAFSRTLQKVATLDFALKDPLTGVHSVLSAVRYGRRLRPDVVYDNLGWSLAASIAAGRVVGAPVVSHVHGFADGRMGRSQKVFLPAVHSFIAVSGYVRGLMLGYGVPEGKVTVVYNGVDLSAYPMGGLVERQAARLSLGLGEETYVVLFYGRMHPTKGVHVLLEATRVIRNAGIPIELLLVGNAQDPEYVRELRQSGDDLICHWLPAQPDITTPLHAADVVAVPSVWDDPFPRVVIEGMASGRPVVASSTGGIPEMLTGPFEAMLFPGGDAAELAERLTGLYDWRSTRPELAADCVAHVRTGHTLDVMVDGIEQQLSAAATS